MPLMQKIIKILLLIAVLGPFATPVQAQTESSKHPSHGLMWNKTGLPAVFPLQVKTTKGKNYVLLLSDPQTGADVLAAYITGGQFFRVLVPPGTFRVRFAYGVTWLDDGAMFGEAGKTNIIEMPEPMTFQVLGLGRKTGHLIDLTRDQPSRMTQARLSNCQTVSWINQVVPLHIDHRSLSQAGVTAQVLQHNVRFKYC